MPLSWPMGWAGRAHGRCCATRFYSAARPSSSAWLKALERWESCVKFLGHSVAPSRSRSVTRSSLISSAAKPWYALSAPAFRCRFASTFTARSENPLCSQQEMANRADKWVVRCHRS